jgi:hypothetical protein
MAERGNVTSKRHLHLTPRLLAKKRHGHIRNLKATVVRLVFRVPEQLLPFLHAFLQASRIWGDFKDRRPLERDKFGIPRPTCLCVRRQCGAARKRNEARMARQSDHLAVSKRLARQKVPETAREKLTATRAALARDRLPNGSVIKNPGPIARPANGAKTIMTCSPLAW